MTTTQTKRFYCHDCRRTPPEDGTVSGRPYWWPETLAAWTRTTAGRTPSRRAR